MTCRLGNLRTASFTRLTACTSSWLACLTLAVAPAATGESPEYVQPWHPVLAPAADHFTSFFLMKYVAYLLGAGLLLSHAAQAQLGVRAGALFSRLAYHQDQDYLLASTRPRVGYEAGVFYELPLGHHWSLVPELDFQRQNQQLRLASYQLIDAFFEGDYHLTHSQLSLPVLVRASLGKCYLEAGPQLTYLVGGRQVGHETLYGFATYSQDVDRPTAERFRRFDIGACVGVGVRLRAGWGVNLRAYQSLRATGLGPGTYTPYGQTYATQLYQQNLQASLTYQLSPRQ